MDKELGELIENFIDQSENFIMTEAMRLFIEAEDENIKLQALELLRRIG